MRRIRVGAMLAKSARESGMKPAAIAVITDKSEASARSWMAENAELSGHDLILLAAAIPAFYKRIMEVLDGLRNGAAA